VTGHRNPTRRRAVGAAVAATALSLVVVATAPLTASAAVGRKSTTTAADPYANTDLHAPAATLTGAGSTFDQPFFTRAFYVYHQTDPGLTVNYASIGSGGGIAQFQAGTVNFGATDVPMVATDLAKDTGGPALQVPIDLGGVAISYHLPGVGSALHLTPSVLAAIFLGNITMWNNSALKKLNPKINLPNQPITVVHRSDGSGTSYIFSNYLSDVSPTWLSKVGTGKSLNWPVGIGEKGNEGVAGFISGTPYTIGYVELAYALQNNFPAAWLLNKRGNYVKPTFDSVAAAAASKPNLSATNFPIVNSNGANAYPISGYSWVLVYQQQKDATTGTALVDVLDWLSHAGQKPAKALGYVPLPPNIQQLARTTLLKVVGPDGTVLLKK
jgi:phosphate transport system substrate-binding protein